MIFNENITLKIVNENYPMKIQLLKLGIIYIFKSLEWKNSDEIYEINLLKYRCNKWMSYYLEYIKRFLTYKETKN
jgi:hypothetical protein